MQSKRHKKRQHSDKAPEGWRPHEPDLMPPPKADIGHITVSLYGYTVHVPFKQPGDKGARRCRSDHLAIPVGDEWLVMSLREAALEAVRRMPRVMTRKERNAA